MTNKQACRLGLRFLSFALMDDLLDLTWGSSSSNGTASSANTKSASAPSKQANQNGRTFDAFDSLAGSLTPSSANYSSSSFRSASPSLTPTAISPAVSRARSPVSASTTTTSINDAFSSLFADTAGSKGSVSSAVQRSNTASLAEQLESQRSALR